MNYAKNEDYFTNRNNSRIGNPSPAASGFGYTVLEDLLQEPVTLSEFKEHARIDHNVDDNLIGYYLKSARETLEDMSQLSFGEKKIRFTAIRAPKQWKLVNGPYVSVDTPGFTLFDDHLMEGGEMVEIELTTGWPNDILPDNFKVAIMRFAAGLYMNRENNQYDEQGRLMPNREVVDEAFAMIRSRANITWPC